MCTEKLTVLDFHLWVLIGNREENLRETCPKFVAVRTSFRGGDLINSNEIGYH